MNQHTPGPWKAEPAHPKHRVKWMIHRKTETEDGGYFGTVEALHGTQLAIDIAAANARLIAAAPDLLTACETAQSALRATSQAEKDYSWELKLLREAIKKARNAP